MDRIAFILDEHVSNAVAHALRRRGIDVVTAREAGLLGAADPEYLLRSVDTGRVVVTHDADFLTLGEGFEHAGIAYCEQGSRTIGQVIAALTLIYEVLTPSEMAGQVQFL